MASYVRNIRTKNYQNLLIDFPVTGEEVGDAFGTQYTNGVHDSVTENSIWAQKSYVFHAPRTRLNTLPPN